MSSNEQSIMMISSGLLLLTIELKTPYIEIGFWNVNIKKIFTFYKMAGNIQYFIVLSIKKSMKHKLLTG